MKNKKNWKLSKIEIKFEKGYEFKELEEEKHDRYVGKIQFANDQEESFNLNIPPKMTERYLYIMSEDIITTAEVLGQKIADSINDNL